MKADHWRSQCLLHSSPSSPMVIEKSQVPSRAEAGNCQHSANMPRQMKAQDLLGGVLLLPGALEHTYRMYLDTQVGRPAG